MKGRKAPSFFSLTDPYITQVDVMVLYFQLNRRRRLGIEDVIGILRRLPIGVQLQLVSTRSHLAEFELTLLPFARFFVRERHRRWTWLTCFEERNENVRNSVAVLIDNSSCHIVELTVTHVDHGSHVVLHRVLSVWLLFADLVTFMDLERSKSRTIFEPSVTSKP